MGDIKKLIEIILSDTKISDSAATLYRDEPIIKTAAQMANYLPPECREMRKIAKSRDAMYKSTAWLFYTQGKFMEKFEDDFDYHGEFAVYFPTYQAMNDLQLRGYFSWRAKVRRGKVEQTSLSFAFVYIYELLNLIGVSTPEEGFAALRAFWGAYGSIDTRVNHYIKQWLSDFVVYYNLNPALLAEFADTAFEQALLTLQDADGREDGELFAALVTLSSYNLENSRLYKERPEDVRAVACSVFRSYSTYYGKNRKNSLCEKLFGRVFNGQYVMFRSAVFYDREKYQSYEYAVNSIHKYRCRGGLWSCEKYYGRVGKSTELGAMLKAVDCALREKLAFTPLIKPGKVTKALAAIIAKEIDAYIDEKKRNAAPKIEIDISKLSGIRSAALETQSKLIVDDEAQEDAFEQEPEPAESGVLDKTEAALVRLLLVGGDHAAFGRENGIMTEVIIDSINEKLFDIFGDSVIAFDGDTPAVIDDYAEELKGIVGI